jgi:hypothetical protein
MKKAIFFVTLSVVLLAAARLAAGYGTADSVGQTQARGAMVFDVKLTRDEWLVVEAGLSGLGVVSFVAAALAYLQRKRIR